MSKETTCNYECPADTDDCIKSCDNCDSIYSDTCCCLGKYPIDYKARAERYEKALREIADFHEAMYEYDSPQNIAKQVLQGD